MCECVAKINKKLAKNDQRLPTMIQLDFSQAGATVPTAERLEIPLLRLDGKPERRMRAAKCIAGNFCPFCGEKSA